jgi:hypothetical protein
VAQWLRVDLRALVVVEVPACRVGCVKSLAGESSESASGKPHSCPWQELGVVRLLAHLRK